ncbi:MAG: class I SAM-dependent methyltransferase [Chloroflexi bacterium]|nr:class I SAM-dependent methyltransferase [Chloroflexota bacterium]
MRRILRPIKKFVVKITPKYLLETLAEVECTIARRWVSSAHRRLMAIQWSLPSQPEFFDHQIDLFYWWLATRNSLWLERGVFGSLALRGGCVLELACGDGFNARNFYSLRSERVVACDFDPKAIKTAEGKNSASNIEFLLADIRTEMPEGRFENIIWDAAIEHFTPDEIAKIMDNIQSRLTDDGILCGYTIVEKPDGTKSLSHHEYEFKSKEDLLRFISPYFKNVTVFETEYPVRHNLYFWASDGILPFGPGWSEAVTYCR